MTILWWTEEPTSQSWFKTNGWIILAAISVILFIATIVLVVLYIRACVNEKKEASNNAATVDFVDALGGKDNIIACEAKGSRLVLVLKDYDIINDEALTALGVTSKIKASDKLTLIVGQKSKEIEDSVK